MRFLSVYRYLTLGGVETVMMARNEHLPSIRIDAHSWFFSDGPGRTIFEGKEDSLHIGDLSDLHRFAERWRPDVLSIIDTPEALSVLEHLSYRPSVIIEVHSPYPENRVYLQGLDIGRVDAFVVPTDHQMEIVKGLVGQGRPVIKAPNPIRSSFLEPVRTYAEKSSRPIVGWIGRLDRLKNWSFYLRILEALRTEGLSFEGWLVGNGSSASADQRFIDQSKRLGVLGLLRWYYSLPHPIVRQFLDAVRASGGVYLSTARDESFGMTVAEAMARECVVIAPDKPPFNELIQNGQNGLLYAGKYAGKSVNDVSRLIRSVTTDQQLRGKLASRAREMILTNHSPDVALDAFHQILRWISKAGEGLEHVT